MNKKNPLQFRLGTRQVVRGLEKGLEGMRVGGEREITIPPELGYGKNGSGNVIPPNATLVFSVQLLGVG
jgi:peptidylprolyl isomerase/FKBP-type peptidyl-prolyl cis-trans isomerase FkpA